MSEASTKQDMQCLKILLAEDNLVNQKVLRIILERIGCQYDIAEDGADAIRRFCEGNYQIVLMDCQMPNMDGLQAAAKIRTLEAAANRPRIPIIAMTANAMKGDRDRCIQAGMDDFLSKPFKSQQLVEVITLWGGKNAV